MTRAPGFADALRDVRRWAAALLVALAFGLAAALPARAGPPPPVASPAWIVVDGRTGETLGGESVDSERPMASTTKIMTALLVLERGGLGERAVVPPEAEVGESTARLEPGEALGVGDLLTGLLVASGNDAAVTLADHVAGSQDAFVALMNRRARELGLRRTRYANPHGLDAKGHHSSVRDLVALARVAMRRPAFRAAVGARRATIPGPGGVGTRKLVSENVLLDSDPSVDGVKTGQTDGAGYALVAHARRGGVGLYVAAIGAPSADARALDGAALLDWGFSRYARPTLLPGGAEVASVAVRDRPGTRVGLRAPGPLVAPIRLGRPLTEIVVAPAQVTAPVSAGQRLGTLEIRQGGRRVAAAPLVAARGVGTPGLWDRLRSGWRGLTS